MNSSRTPSSPLRTLLSLAALGAIFATASVVSADPRDRAGDIDRPEVATSDIPAISDWVAVDDVGGVALPNSGTVSARGIRAVGVSACPASVSGTLGTCGSAPNCTTFLSTGRIFRNAVASACSPAKACPGGSAGGPFQNNVYQFDIPADCQCLTVSHNTGSCGANVHGAAYLGAVAPFAAYPANCVPTSGVTYLGDVGSSVTQPYSFEIPPNANSTILSIVTNSNFTPPPGCTFSFSIACVPSTSVACLIRGIEAKLDTLSADVAAKSCETIRLLNTPDGRREACSDVVKSNCGTGYSWNSVSTGGPQQDCP